MEGSLAAHPTDIILASASPRRRVLMGLLGVPFDVAVPDVLEDMDGDGSPRECVLRLASDKAAAVALRFPGRIVVAADTIVALDDQILGKPSDSADAMRMLALLRGRWHRVWTGIAVRSGPGAALRAAEWTDVLMRDYANAEAAAYVATGDPLDKAAAYAIQHEQFSPVALISGCYANVMGLPLCRLHAMLAQVGLAHRETPLVRCAAHLHIECQGQLSSLADSDKEV